MLYNLRLTYYRWRYGARSGKTTRLLVARIPLDTTGWKALGVLALVAWLLFGVQVYAAWQARPQYKPLEARALVVRRDPPIIFQTVIVPGPTAPPLIATPTALPEPPRVDPPILGDALVLPPVAPEPAAQPSGGNEPPAGMRFPIVNGVDATGARVEGPSEKGSRVNARSYR